MRNIQHFIRRSTHELDTEAAVEIYRRNWVIVEHYGFVTKINDARGIYEGIIDRVLFVAKNNRGHK